MEVLQDKVYLGLLLLFFVCFAQPEVTLLNVLSTTKWAKSLFLLKKKSQHLRDMCRHKNKHS